jgi:hypothetical protein
MYTAVGEVVAQAYRSTWEQVIASRIFTPLGMKSSVANLHEMHRLANRATGYRYDAAANSWRPVPPPQSLKALAPAGAIAASARDMAQWMLMLTSGGTFEGRRFVSETSLRDITAPHVAINDRVSYALGWASYEWNHLRVVEHNGGSDGISALMSYIPERRVGFVLMANIGANAMTRIAGAGWLLYPILLGQASEGVPPTSQPPPSSVAPTISTEHAIPPPDALLKRMVAAAGGESVLRGHVSLEITATKSYDNHGVAGPFTIRAQTPARREELEIWHAAGREIGRVRSYFDGATGGQEDTLGQDEINGADANAEARRNDDFRPLLNMPILYPFMKVLGRAMIDHEPASVLERSAAGEPAERVYVSERSALVLRRQRGEESTRYEDYRRVDGEMVPFRIVIDDSLGRTTIQVKNARFNVKFPAGTFAPRKKAPDHP